MESYPEKIATNRSPRLAKRMGWGALVLAIVVAILFGLAHGKGSRARHAERRALRVLTPAQVKTNGYTLSLIHI